MKTLYEKLQEIKTAEGIMAWNLPSVLMHTYSDEKRKSMEQMVTGLDSYLSTVTQNMNREVIDTHIGQLGRRADLLPQVIAGKTSFTAYSQPIIERTKKFESELGTNTPAEFSVDDLLQSTETKDITATLVREAILNPYATFNSRTILPSDAIQKYIKIEEWLKEFSRGSSFLSLALPLAGAVSFAILGGCMGHVAANNFFSSSEDAIITSRIFGGLAGGASYFAGLIYLGSRLTNILSKDIKQLTKEREDFERRAKFLDDEITNLCR